MKDYKHSTPKAAKVPDGALKGLGKGMTEKDVRRGYSKPK